MEDYARFRQELATLERGVAIFLGILAIGAIGAIVALIWEVYRPL